MFIPPSPSPLPSQPPPLPPSMPHPPHHCHLHHAIVTTSTPSTSSPRVTISTNTTISRPPSAAQLRTTTTSTFGCHEGRLVLWINRSGCVWLAV
ncbi:hypothetical protein Tco_0207667 [Tanacetum coccineum]